MNKLFNAPAMPSQIHKDIGDDLSGPVVGDVATAIAMHKRNTVRADECAVFSFKTNRIDSGMGQQPQLVCRRGISMLVKGLHRTPRF
jgi:hypothetical protein